MTTSELARLLGVSEQWCELARMRKQGPKFTKLSTRCIRYRRADVISWLDERMRLSNAKYFSGRKSGRAA